MLVLVVLWLAFFAINFNIAMMIPLLPFIERDIGLSSTEAGLVLAAFPVTALIANLLLGPFIDRFGRKRFITAGALACAAALLATAASPSALPIILGRAATGLFMPMVGASVFAAIADYYAPAARGRVAGYVTSAAPIAFLLSMSMGVLLGGLFAWQVPVVLFAGTMLLLAAGAAVLPPTPEEGLSTAPISRATYRHRLLSLSLDAGTRLLLPAYFCWSAAVFVFLGLYPTWLVQRGLAGLGPETIGMLLFLGEIGGLAGALFSGRLAGRFGHPLAASAAAAIATAAVIAAVPFGDGLAVVQALAYWGFAFGRDLMLAAILGGAMLLVSASQRGSLNAILNAVYQTGATAGGLASAWLYAFRPDFTANAAAAAALLLACGGMLWRIGRVPR